MNRPLARRAGPFLAASAGLLLSVAAGTPHAQNVAAPPPVQWPTPPLPDGEDPGAVLRLEPEATTTR